MKDPVFMPERWTCKVPGDIEITLHSFSAKEADVEYPISIDKGGGMLTEMTCDEAIFFGQALIAAAAKFRAVTAERAKLEGDG